MTDGMVLDIFRCSLHDGPGIRTTVFLKGCPLSCSWCHNPESQSRGPVLLFNPQRCTFCARCASICPHHGHNITGEAHSVDRTDCTACGTCAAACPADALEIRGRRMTVEQVIAEVQKDMDYYRQSGGGLTLSGGEPMMQFPFAHDLAAAAKSLGIHTVLETSGLATAERFRQIMPLIDLFLYDYKATDPARHAELTGVSNELIMANLDMLYTAGAYITLRCPLVPGINDDEAHLSAIAALSKRYPKLTGIEIMSYHAMGNEKARRTGMAVKLDLPNTAAETKQAWKTKLAMQGCEVTVN